MTPFWLEILPPVGATIRVVHRASVMRRAAATPHIAANDNGLPIDAEICRAASELVRDFDIAARDIAAMKTRIAFDVNDTAEFRRWRMIGHAVETHFASRRNRTTHADLREMLDRLAQ